MRAALKREARALDRRTDPTRAARGLCRGSGEGLGEQTKARRQRQSVRFLSVSADEEADDEADENDDRDDDEDGREEKGEGGDEEGGRAAHDSPLQVGFYFQTSRIVRTPPDSRLRPPPTQAPTDNSQRRQGGEDVMDRRGSPVSPYSLPQSRGCEDALDRRGGGEECSGGRGQTIIEV